MASRSRARSAASCASTTSSGLVSGVGNVSGGSPCPRGPRTADSGDGGGGGATRSHASARHHQAIVQAPPLETLRRAGRWYLHRGAAWSTRMGGAGAARAGAAAPLVASRALLDELVYRVTAAAHLLDQEQPARHGGLRAEIPHTTPVLMSQMVGWRPFWWQKGVT